MRRLAVGIASAFLLVSCGGGSAQLPDADPSITQTPSSPAPQVTDSTLFAGAASASVLPTVDGAQDYLSGVPGWASTTKVEPNNIGLYIPAFDQGSVDISNGSDNASWVHDDIQASALALDNNGERVVLVSVDVYMIFSSDVDEIVRLAHQQMDPEWLPVPILINTTHNHHGPDTAFSINPDWYAHMAKVVAQIITVAISTIQPATATVATGVDRFGNSDGRDPIVLDPRLNVLQISAADQKSVIATVVQWNNHPETTLGWDPPGVENLSAICVQKGWAADDCSAEGRYFTADYPGVLRTRLQEAFGGEVLYMNGAVGSQIGPGDADVWNITAAHPVGNGWTAPSGAEPVAGCEDLRCRNLARTEAIGAQLSVAVLDLLQNAQPLKIETVAVESQYFYTQLTNIGFRLLIADGDLGWQAPPLYTCTPNIPYSDETCVAAQGALQDDALLTPLTDSQITVGDVLKTRLTYLDLGSVGIMFMPGELPPELVVGLPSDFDTATAKYYLEGSGIHAQGIDYDLPGYLLSLVDEEIVFTVGLGTEELGYWVPVSDYRLKCLEIALPAGTTCADLHARGIIEHADSISGLTCKKITDDASTLAVYASPDATAIVAICRYGQALGRELGEPQGHYEETNAAGWNLVDDLWNAATKLFGNAGTGRINPDNPGYTIQYPPL